MNKPRPPRVLVLSTHPITLRNLMRGQLGYLAQRGLEIIAVAAPGPELDEVARREKIETIGVPMKRQIRPLSDFIALVRLIRVMRRLRPQVVKAGTPKAALLGLLAARLTGVPIRIYLLRGLRLETARGWHRWLLAPFERLTARCATRIICVSRSLQEAYVQSGFALCEKTVVLASGSSNGVDASRFRCSPEDKVRLREKLNIAQSALVIGFVGRLVRDKGIAELLAAFRKISAQLPDARLLILGDIEPGQRIATSDAEFIRQDRRVIAPGFVAEPASYYAAMDVLAFPSYREGFPNVPLEAAAAERPTVGFCATGTRDAIVNGVTGLLVPIGNADALADALLTYLCDEQLRKQHGRTARQRVESEFACQRVWEANCCEIVNLLDKNTPLPTQPGIVNSYEAEPVAANADNSRKSKTP